MEKDGNSNMKFNYLRKEYRNRPLMLSALDRNPFSQLKMWLQEAIDANVMEPNAMTLSTASKEGRPSSRIVLLKGLEDEGLEFYTNYQSRKGCELIDNPYASLNFYWKELEKQVSIDGTVEKLSQEKSLVYFHQRPRNSQIGAWCSPQGQVISSKGWLEQHFLDVQQQYENKEIPLPPFWGGFRLVPDLFLFWQGQENRLHDRFRYTRTTDGWHIDQLAP